MFNIPPAAAHCAAGAGGGAGGPGGVAAMVWVKAQAAVEEACRRRTEMLL